MKRLLLKGCDRCHGDLFADPSDRTGQTLVCLQCGVEVPLRRMLMRRLAQRAAAQPTMARAAA